MAHKRLTFDQVNQMRTMVKNGAIPEDIAKHFGLSISSVHNYKNRFKSEGLSFPTVRGKRPMGSIETKNIVSEPKVQSTPAAASANTPPSKKAEKEAFKFIVNGTSVKISANAKDISIDKGSIEVNF